MTATAVDLGKLREERAKVPKDEYKRETFGQRFRRKAKAAVHFDEKEIRTIRNAALQAVFIALCMVFFRTILPVPL